MSEDHVAELVELLQLERLEDNLFRGQSRDIGTRFVFGGQENDNYDANAAYACAFSPDVVLALLDELELVRVERNTIRDQLIDLQGEP